MKRMAEAILIIFTLAMIVSCVGNPSIYDGVVYQLTDVKVWESNK